MSDQPVQKKRLSDRILEALKQSMDQGNEDVSALLSQALELSMKAPKPASSSSAEERRDYPEEIENFLRIFDEMENDNSGGY